MRSIVVTGFPRQGEYLARLLSDYGADARAAYFSDARIAVLHAALRALGAEAAISFGGPWPKELVERVCAFRRRPMIVLWAGSDVLRIASEPRELERLRLLPIVHWTCADHLVTELADLGIDARYVPVASAGAPARLAPLPSEFTVLTYLPVPRRAFYGRAIVWNAARNMQDVRFIVCGPGPPEPDAPPNIRYVGEVSDMNSLLDASSVLLRFPEHDGLSQHVVEALARGRHVIWTYELPGVVQASSAGHVTEALSDLYDAHRHGKLGVNGDGARFAAEHYAPEKIARRVLAAIDDAIAAKPARSGIDEAERRFQVAISGQQLLAARVAANSVRYSNRLSGSVLSSRTHSDTAFSAMKLVASDAWYTIGEPDPPRAFEIAALLSNKKRIVHWLGGDVDTLAQSGRRLRQFRSKRYEHVAHTDEVARRLSEFGLRSSVVPLPAAVPVTQVSPLPRTFTLLLYVPSERPEFYGRYQYEGLMASLSGENLHYIIFGGGRIDVPAGVSVERLAWRSELGTVYDRSTALVCFMQPNAVSMMPVDALSHGRYIMCSNEFAYAIRVRDSHELELAVRGLLARHCEGTLKPQYEGARRIADMYSPQRCLTMLADLATTGARF